MLLPGVFLCVVSAVSSGFQREVFDDWPASL